MMIKTFTASLLSAIMMTGAAAANPTPEPLGQEITSETVVDQAEVIRIVDALDAAVDSKEWALARSLFTETIDVDFTSLVGGEPATIPADDLIAGWAANLTAEKESFHLRGNHRVTFSGRDVAIVLSHGYAWNRMERGALVENGGDPLWEVWGDYEHRFVRTEDGWKLSGMTFNATAERGNPFVRNTPGS